ncbi:MAG: hypothetical protein ABI844_12420 [Saprospiraceae bacterium]
MKFKKLLALPVLILICFQVIAQKNKSLTNAKDTAAFMEELANEMRKATLEELKMTEILPDKLSNMYPPNSIKDADLKEMNNAFTQSFYIRPSPFNKNELLTESDYFFYPDPSYVTNDITWMKALDIKGKNHLLAMPETNDAMKFSIEFNGNNPIKLQDESGDQIIRAEGEIKIRVPTLFQKINFKKTELNQSKNIDTFKIFLSRMENNLAAIWIKNDYTNAKLYAFNMSGQPLDITSHTSFVYSGDPKDAVAYKLSKELGPGSYMYIKAQGNIASIDVVFATKFTESKFPLTATLLPVFESGRAKLAKERYTEYHPENFSSLKNPEESMFDAKKNLSINKEYSEWEKTTKWRVMYQLPADMVQSKYADASFINVTAYLKGKPIKTFESEGYLDIVTRTLSFIPQDDDYKPLEYDQIKGELIIKYPKSIQTVTVKKGEKKYGVEQMETNKVVYNDKDLGAVSKLIDKSELMAVRAFGKGRWPLKNDSYYSSYSQDDVSLQEIYYWGNVTKVEIDQPMNILEMTLPFDIRKTVELKTKTKKK